MSPIEMWENKVYPSSLPLSRVTIADSFLYGQDFLCMYNVICTMLRKNGIIFFSILQFLFNIKALEYFLVYVYISALLLTTA